MNKKTYFTIILALTLLILLTLYLYIRFYDCTIYSTILANIFGGLITGFIILLVGNIKSKILFNNIEISNILEEIVTDIKDWLHKVDVFIYYSEDIDLLAKEIKAEECYIDWQNIYNKLCLNEINKYYKKKDSNILEVNLIKEKLENSYSINLSDIKNINIEEFKKTLKSQRLEMRKLNNWINSEISRYKLENRKINSSII